MKIQSGDIVRHRVFPPVEGVVWSAQENVNAEPRISVMQGNGLLFWDNESTWEVIGNVQNLSEWKPYMNNEVQEDEDVIDVEFREL